MGCTAVTQCGCHWLPIQRVGEWLLLLVQGTFLFRNCCCYSTGESRLVLRSCAGLHPNPSPGQPPESATGLLLSLRARACCNDDKSMHEAESQASFLLFLLLLLCKVGLVLQHSRGQEVTEKNNFNTVLGRLLCLGPLLLGRLGAAAAAAAAAWPRPCFGRSLGAGPQGVFRAWLTGAGSPARAAASSPSCWARRLACMLIVAVLETRCRLLASSVHSVRHSPLLLRLHGASP